MAKLLFNRLKPYRGDPEVRHSVRQSNRPSPIFEENPNDVDTEEEKKDRPFHVFKPTTAESQAARKKPKLSFKQLPEITEQDTESEIENTSRDGNNEPQASPQLTAYEKIAGNDSESSESEQFTVRNDEPERLLDANNDSQNESQQDSDVPTGRESRVRRPPVRFGIDEYINKCK